MTTLTDNTEGGTVGGVVEETEAMGGECVVETDEDEAVSVFCVVLVVTFKVIVTSDVVVAGDFVRVVDDLVVSVILNCSVVDEIKFVSALSVAD